MGKKKKQIIGFKYYLGMHMIVCHSPVDKVEKFIVGDREAWSGNVTSSTDVTVDAPNLFGGEKKEGGVSGTVSILMGEPTQQKNPYLQSRIQTLVPAFRGVLSIILKQCYVCAMSPYPKPWAFKIKSIPAKSWYPEKAEINGSANPIHVIYETLTNSDWGMGISTSMINDTKFRQAADTCYSENFGVSMMLSSQDSIERFIYEVLGHCNGMFFIEPSTGKFAIKLLREDYDVNTLPVFDETNIITLDSFDRPTYGEIVNEVVLTYRPQGGITDDSITVQDLASIQAQGGIVSHSVTYPGCDNAINASRLAMRDLRQKSTPLARIKMKVNRKGWNLTLGEVFKFKWTEHNIDNMICRVLSINAGDIKSGEIIIEAAEDIFGLPFTTYTGNQQSLWTDPNSPPSQYLNQFYKEVSYFELNDLLNDADFNSIDATSAYVKGYVAEMPQYSIGYELWTGATNSTSSKEFRDFAPATPFALLSTNITEIQTSITLNSFSSSCNQAVVGQYCLIDNEFVRLDSIDLNTGAVTIGRGCFDTIPTKHNINSKFLFAEVSSTFDQTEWLANSSIFCRALMRTSDDIFEIASASDNTVPLVGRFIKPYAPGKFKINNEYYPSAVTTSNLQVTWSHRDKTQQLVRPIIDTTADSIGPEVGVTYSIQLLKASDSSVLESATGLTGTSYGFNYFGSQNVKVKLWSEKNTQNSYQTHEHEFVLTMNPITSLLLHFNGTNGSTSIIDSSPSPKSFSVASNAQLTTTDPKFGTACLLLDGSSDWIQCPGHNDFVLGSVDFTIECFIKTTDNNFALFDFYTSGQNGWQVFITSAGKLSFYAASSQVVVSSISINTGNWIHIAITRQGTSLKLWINGVQDGSVTNSTNMNYLTSIFAIGAQVANRNGAYDLSGSVDEVHIRKGEAVYTADFTPPTNELS